MEQSSDVRTLEDHASGLELTVTRLAKVQEALERERDSVGATLNDSRLALDGERAEADRRAAALHRRAVELRYKDVQSRHEQFNPVQH